MLESSDSPILGAPGDASDQIGQQGHSGRAEHFEDGAQAMTRASVGLLVLSCAILASLPTNVLTAADAWTATMSPMLKRYCWECHGEQRQKGGLNIQSLASGAEIEPKAELLARRLAAEEMPPTRAPQPSATDRAALIAWLRTLVPADRPLIPDDPGVVVIPRLTPTQYERVIRDLTGVEMPLAGQLPRDGGSGEGFDNVGVAQAMTPMHLQAYIAVANLVLGHARILPGMPIEWNPASRIEAGATEQLYAAIMSDYQQWFADEAMKTVAAHVETLSSVLPDDRLFQRSVVHWGFFGWRWIIPYLHAAWRVPPPRRARPSRSDAGSGGGGLPAAIARRGPVPPGFLPRDDHREPLLARSCEPLGGVAATACYRPGAPAEVLGHRGVDGA